MSGLMAERRTSLTYVAGLLSLIALGINGCSSSDDNRSEIPGDEAGCTDGSCGEPSCSVNEDCASGSCGLSGFCAPLPPEGNDGPGGMDTQFPDLLTGDVDDETDDNQTCVQLDVNFDRVTPTVVLLIDQSGSMDADFDQGKDRWETLRDSLSNPTESLLKSLETEVRFGMALYTSENGSTTGQQCPLLQSVDIALSNFDSMKTLLHNHGPEDDTPTAESVQAIATLLDSYTEEGPKSIILATDGEPDTCANPNAQNNATDQAAARALSVAAVTAAFEKGIHTYIISVGTETSQQHLKDLAVAGAGGDQDAEAFTVTNTAALENAFSTAIGNARSCDFKLEGTVQPSEAERGTVLLDGDTLVFGDTNGWVMPDDQTVRVQGSACDTLKSSAAGISIEFPCGVYRIIPR